MAKISKRVLDKHLRAVELLEQEKIDSMDRHFIYENYHEGAGKMNNLISAHFTPRSIAHSVALNVRCHNWVDFGAGIGRLSYAIYNQNRFDPKPFLGICIENCVEYYNVGRKLLPEMIWINGSIFDQEVIDEVKMLMNGESFSIVSNPPYGNQVKGDHPLMKYTGSKFEYKAMEMGAIYGAYDGAFLIPQQSAPFRMSGGFRGETLREKWLTSDYLKFKKQTDLRIDANAGFDTTCFFDDDPGWKDVDLVTEIAIVEYEEGDYQLKVIEPKEDLNQLKMF